MHRTTYCIGSRFVLIMFSFIEGRQVVFQTRRFLVDHFKNPPGLLAFLGAYRAPTPESAAAQKWFQRGSVPSDWLPVVLSYLEIDNGAPISLIPYLEVGHVV